MDGRYGASYHLKPNRNREEGHDDDDDDDATGHFNLMINSALSQSTTTGSGSSGGGSSSSNNGRWWFHPALFRCPSPPYRLPPPPRNFKQLLQWQFHDMKMLMGTDLKVYR